MSSEYYLRNRISGEAFFIDMDIQFMYPHKLAPLICPICSSNEVNNAAHKALHAGFKSSELAAFSSGDNVSLDPYHALGLPKVVEVSDKVFVVKRYDELDAESRSALKRLSIAENVISTIESNLNEQAQLAGSPTCDSLIGIIRTITTKAIFADGSKLHYFNLEGFGYTHDETTFPVPDKEVDSVELIVKAAEWWCNRIKADRLSLKEVLNASVGVADPFTWLAWWNAQEKAREAREEDLPEVIPSKPPRAGTNDDDFSELPNSFNSSPSYNKEELPDSRSQLADGRRRLQSSMSADELLLRNTDDKRK